MFRPTTIIVSVLCFTFIARAIYLINGQTEEIKFYDNQIVKVDSIVSLNGGPKPNYIVHLKTIDKQYDISVHGKDALEILRSVPLGSNIIVSFEARNLYNRDHKKIGTQCKLKSWKK